MHWSLTAAAILGPLAPLLYWFEDGSLDALSSALPAIFTVQRLSAGAGKRRDPTDGGEFDFVMVGAGAAGCALAYRLTQDPRFRVLLLEAGGEEVEITTVPFFISQFMGTDANWHYVTTPQNTSCVGMDDSRCDYPFGHIIGGSTTINYMFNIKGNKRDFDNWAALGNEGWSWDEVLPYFKKVEDVRIPELQNREGRGYGGRIRTTYPDYFSGTGQLLLQGAREAGFPTPDDYNAGEQAGMNRIQTTTFNGARWSANRGYLDAARARPNLFLRPRSYVTRLVLEGSHVRGVRYQRHGREEVATATREVILCAGAVNSPAILMRSGIGRADHLRELGIPLVQDLPVGLNLMDHTSLFGTFTLLNQTVSPGLPGILLNPKSYLDYFLRRKGPLTNTGTFEVVSFHNLEGTPYYSPNWPAIEIIYTSANFFATRKYASVFRATKIFDETVKPVAHLPMFFPTIFALRPKSRGRIYLQNDDPFSAPLIDPAALSHPDDVEMVLAGLREFQRILATPSFQSVGARMLDTPISGCESFIFDTDDYWRCAMRYASITTWHQSGTCKMAPIGDPTGVVTPNLTVVGVEGLRVVDASIIPQIVSGHLQMTSYMIGEKISDIIKAKYEN